MICIYENRYNELSSTFDMERPNLISAWVALDEIAKESDCPILSKATANAAENLIRSINRIGDKCGYKTLEAHK